MKIAVVGAGFAGLALSWHLLQYEGVSVDLFDPLGIGRGTSGMSTGLMHPFLGRHAPRSWRALEGMEASLELFRIANVPVVSQGILRIAMTPSQKKAFRKRARHDADALWVENVQTRGADAIAAPGLWIPSGVTVQPESYLRGLWAACEQRGARLHLVRIESLDELARYDQAVLATGDQTPKWAPLDMQLVRGQALTVKSDQSLPCSLIGTGHIALTSTPHVFQVGATYEHTPLSPEEATAELLRNAEFFFPPAANFEVLGIKAGVRIAPREGYRPIVQKIAPKIWVFTGLGSRGLLYHALLGKELATSIITSLQ